jgi:hypothetical protein
MAKSKGIFVPAGTIGNSPLQTLNPLLHNPSLQSRARRQAAATQQSIYP